MKLTIKALLVPFLFSTCAFAADTNAQLKLEVRGLADVRATGARVADSGNFSKDRYTNSIRIDGSFTDWKVYTKGWKSDLLKSREGFQVFDITELDYCNDTNFLYLFLKFKPGITERFEPLKRFRKMSSLGTIGVIYFPGAQNVATPTSTKSWESGTRVLIGAGSSVHVNAETNSLAPLVAYEMTAWDNSSHRWGDWFAREASTEAESLIAFGDEGVEMAIPLTDIRKSAEVRLDVVLEEFVPMSETHRITISLQ